MAKRSKKKWIVRLALLAAAAALCAVGWDALRPLVMAETTPVYAQYTVEVGDIETSMSLSGAIELVESESFSASERTTVQEVYVEADQDGLRRRRASAPQQRRDLHGDHRRHGDDAQRGHGATRSGRRWRSPPWRTLSDLRVATSVDEYDVQAPSRPGSSAR